MPKKNTSDHISSTQTHTQHTAFDVDNYKLLVDSIEDYAIFLLDPNGIIVSWNVGAQKLKGYTPSEIIGSHFSVFYRKEDLESNKPALELANSLANGRVVDEGWRIRKDGTQFWANVVVTALFDSHGTHIGFAKITRDSTERKMYEDDLRDAHTKLELSYRELQKLNDLKDEFVSLASHQLRTPATGVKQYIALLLDGFMGDITDQQLDILQKAYDSNERQIEIINDLLQVAQLDAGKIILHKSNVNLHDLITDIIDEQVDAFKQRAQTITVHNNNHALTAYADKVRVRMVVENLIDNASKYTPEHGTITVTCANDAENVYIEVSDTGVGIHHDDMQKLFQKFSRIQNPLTRSVTGSGLGLYWAGKIIQLHEGFIDVESEENEGSSFKIILPIGPIS